MDYGFLLRMARWKAIYLFNGHDKTWSFLQNLRKMITSFGIADMAKAGGLW